ncbi:MAG: hypothetical protein Q4G11_05225 [Gallicola sp.]|nr:hypothetical protein [Gallicola sp.]
MKLDDLAKKPLERGEVIVDGIFFMNGNLDLESEKMLSLGTVIVSIDAGVTWKKCTDVPQTTYRLGILGEYVNQNGVAEVLLIGRVKQVGEVGAAIKTALFSQNIIME